MNRLLTILLILTSSMFGQTAAGAAAESTADYSGMYTFLEDGEFVQLTVENHGMVTGFVSRYKGGDDNQKTFVDHFFKQGRLEGKKLTFTTEISQNVAYEFKGTVERGEGKKPEDEGYYVLKGVLTQSKLDSDKKTASKSQAVTFKSFPQDVEVDPPK